MINHDRRPNENREVEEERKVMRQTKIDEYIKITKPQITTKELNTMKIIHINVNGIAAKNTKWSNFYKKQNQIS